MNFSTDVIRTARCCCMYSNCGLFFSVLENETRLRVELAAWFLLMSHFGYLIGETTPPVYTIHKYILVKEWVPPKKNWVSDFSENRNEFFKS